MDFKKIIIFIIIFFLLIWIYWVFRMLNPWKLILYVGKKGSGKSTIAVKQMSRVPKAIIHVPGRVLFKIKNREIHGPGKFKLVKLKVYSNFKVNIPGLQTEKFNPSELGVSFFPDEYSVCYCDEISLYWWNRNFKSMNEKTVEWFRNQRKYKVKFVGFSQTFDIDKVLRKSLCDRMYLIKNFLITFSVVRLISKSQTIKDSALDCDSQLVESLSFAPIFLPGAFSFTWLPKYIRYFDTNEKFSRFADQPTIPPLPNR